VNNLGLYITTDNVNLRAAPGTDSIIMMTLTKGTAVKIIDFRNNDWYMVNYEGKTGYMKAEFLAEATGINMQEPSVDYITIKGVEYSTSMTGINLTLNDEEIAPLRYMTNLTRLHLNGEQLSDITPLAELKNLTELALWAHHVSDLTPLASLTNLTKLHIYSNQISDLTPLANLKNLTELVVGYNLISDLTPLSGLENLVSLTVWSHQISDLKPLSDLTKLESLTLYARNGISDWAPVEHVPNIISINY